MIDGQSQNITINFDPSAWFVSGTAALDLSDPANKPAIEANIRASLAAFQDDDEVGHENHHGDDDAANHDAGDDKGNDGAGHDAGDDHGGATGGTGTADDHGGHGNDDGSGATTSRSHGIIARAVAPGERGAFLFGARETPGQVGDISAVPGLRNLLSHERRSGCPSRRQRRGEPSSPPTAPNDGGGPH